MFKSHHGQVVVSVVGAILTVTVVSSVCRRSFRLGRRNRKQRQHNSQLQCAVQHGRCTDVQTFQWLTSSADIAAAYAPQMTSIQLVNTPENASIGCLHPLVCTFTELRQLSLVGTRLVHIPYSLPALQKLEELQLSRNTIVCVPGEIGAMTSLRSLDLSHNQIQTLPSSLCKLTNLTALNLMGNKLSKLPDDIGNLHNLRILGLKSNMLVTLPQSFTRLSSLVELFITDNQLTSLPEGFGALTSLVKLQASFNCFSHLPIDLLHAPNLELMRVAVCHLSQLPDQLMHLPTHLIHDEEVSGDTGSLVRSNGNQEEGHLDSAEDPVVFPKLAWFSLGGNPACAPLPKPRPGLLHFSASDLTMGEKLGDGASGEVSRASLHKGDAESGQQAVAVKTFRSDVSPDGRTQEEVAIACALDHPNLTRVIGIVPGPAQIPPAEQPLLVQDELRRRIQRAPFIGISLDEASAIGHTAWLSMHTYIVDKGAREPYFLGVMEITGAPNAVNLAGVVIKALIDIGGLSLQQIGSKLVSIAADGASVMAGELSGVLQRIQASHAPWVLPMHCMGHRVNLVSCGLSNVGLMVKLEYMQSKVFTYFSHSNKKYYDYEAVQADVGVPRHELLRGVDTRWLSILAALDRLWEQYPALLVYFDKEASVKDNFQALEVWHALIDCEGILGLLLTLPLLRRLNSLIKCLQERGLFLHDAIAAIRSTREDINAWYLDPATACQGTAFRTYQQIVHGDAEVSPLVWVPVGAHGTENLAFEVRLPLGSDRLPRAPRVFMLCAAKPGVRRGVDSRLPVGHELFSELITHVRQQAFEAGQAVDDDLLARFPAGSVHEQLCIVDLRHHAVRNDGPVQPSSRAAARERQQHQQQCVNHQRQCQQHKEQFMSSANSLAERFGHVLSPLMAERPLEPPLNGTLLMEQADAAYQVMGDAQLAGRETPAFWASVAGNVDQRGRVSEWLQLARIASVQVPGSVEEERLFSKLAFIKDERRNRLEAEHLNVCLILATQRMYSFTDFPYISAMRKWFAAKERRLAAVPRQPQQPRQPIVVNIDSD